MPQLHSTRVLQTMSILSSIQFSQLIVPYPIDALQDDPFTEEYNGSDGAKETYQIVKSDYEVFREKYSVKK